MTKPYYAPSLPGTVGITFGTTETPVYAGVPYNMAVTCDLGRTLHVFKGGVLAWQRTFPAAWPRAMDVFEGVMFYADGSVLNVCNPHTGFQHGQITMHAAMNSIRATRFNGATYLTICFDVNGANSVRVYRWGNFTLTQTFTNPHVAKHPRGAYFFAGWLFVSDTFGHRVYAVDVASGGMRNSTEVYYPNSINPIAADKVLICAEHENRVFIWDYWPTDSREMVMTAPVLPYSDINATRDQIIAQEHTTGVGTLSPQKSACAVEHSGSNTLYSPNAARITDFGLLVADTDNHRVVLVRDGLLVAEVTGLHNPSNALLF